MLKSSAREDTTHFCPQEPGTSLTCTKSECPAQPEWGVAGVSNDWCINSFCYSRDGNERPCILQLSSIVQLTCCTVYM